MINITYEINGKKVRPERLGNELEKAILTDVGNSIKKKLSSVVCKEHQKRPTVKIVGKNSSSLNFEIDGCCQQVIDESTAKLK